MVKVQLTPDPEAAVVWGKILIWVRAGDYIPVREVYFDEDGVPVREMILSEIQTMDGRNLPTLWEMRSLEADKQGNRTLIKLEKIDFNVDIDAKVFTDKNLTRRDWD